LYFAALAHDGYWPIASFGGEQHFSRFPGEADMQPNLQCTVEKVSPIRAVFVM